MAQKFVVSEEFPNGKLVDLTAEELNQLETDKNNNAIEKEKILAYLTERDACRASAKEKLIALGLTDKEVDCIMWGDFPKEVIPPTEV